MFKQEMAVLKVYVAGEILNYNLIKPGQKVVMSPYTIHEVVNMVLCAGGVPSFADIDRKSTDGHRDRHHCKN